MAFYAVAFLLPRLHLIKTSATLVYLLTTAALLAGAGSIAWAIIRYQFMDVRLIIRRGLFFGRLGRSGRALPVRVQRG